MCLKINLFMLRFQSLPSTTMADSGFVLTSTSSLTSKGHRQCSCKVKLPPNPKQTPFYFSPLLMQWITFLLLALESLSAKCRETRYSVHGDWLEKHAASNMGFWECPSTAAQIGQQDTLMFTPILLRIPALPNWPTWPASRDVCK